MRVTRVGHADVVQQFDSKALGGGDEIAGHFGG